jgi:hypothetical protein
MVRLHTCIPNFRSSPRILSAPHSRFSLAICLIKAIASSAILGLREAAFDLRFQYQRKSSRCQREPRLWLNDEERLFPGTNEPCQQDEKDAIGVRACRPLHLPFEDDELLAQKGIFGDELGFASAKVDEGDQRQGGRERFRPMSQARRERMQAVIQEAPERDQNTSHNKNISIT